MYKPYPRQQVGVDKIIDFANSKTNKKGLFVYPVGYGKSIIIANAVLGIKEKHIINIVPKEELLKQNYEKYVSYGYEADICSASLGKDNVGRVTFATIGTLKKHIDFYLDKDVVIFHDEAQNSSLKGSELDQFFSQIKKCKLIGITATPLRLHKGWLKMMNRMQDCIYSSIEDVVQVHEAISDGLWSPLIYEVENLDSSMLTLNSTGNDYTLKSLERYSKVNDIESKIVEVTNNLLNSGRDSVIVFCSTLSEANFVASCFDDVKVISSKTKKAERKKLISDFKNGIIRGLVNVGILVEGFDYPKLSSIVLARPTNSFGIYYQMIGRLVRKHESKTNGKVVDLSGNFNSFGKIEDVTYEYNDYNNGWECWVGDNRITSYSLSEGRQPTRSQDIFKHEAMLRNKARALSNKDDSYVFTFGKHINKTVKEVYSENADYLKWIVLDSKWDFSTLALRKLRLEIIDVVGVENLFDMVINVLIDDGFNFISLFSQKMNFYTSSNKKFLVTTSSNGLDKDIHYALNQGVNYSFIPDFNTLRMDCAVVFHDGENEATKKSLKDLEILGIPTRIVMY